jgi:hypothetical protein
MDSIYYKNATVAFYATPSLNFSKCSACEYEFQYDLVSIPVVLGYNLGKKKIFYNVEVSPIIEYTRQKELIVNYSNGSYFGKEKVNHAEFLLNGNLNICYSIHKNIFITIGPGIRVDFNSINPIFIAYSANFSLNYLIK